MDFKTIYGLIGPCGAAIVIIAIVSMFICVRSIIYTSISWREFKKRFLDVQRGGERCLRSYTGCNPFLKIIKDIVQTHASHSDDIRAEVAYLFNRNFKIVINSLSILKMITVISPLLGLLGTVSGMLMVFDAVAAAEAQNPEILARGIWQALITTVMGLTVAIPSMVIYYFLSLRMRSFQIESIEHSYRAIVITKQVSGHQE